MKRSEPEYSALTWDIDLQKWTPQTGIPEIARGFAGLRKAYRMLLDAGYSYRSAFASIERINDPQEARDE